MLTRISVSGFKSLGGITLELGQVNVLIGANGSGKTNLLEAIGVLSTAVAGRVDDQALLKRGVRPGIAALYRTSLREEGGKKRKPRAFMNLAGAGRWDSCTARYSVTLKDPFNSSGGAWRYVNESLECAGDHLLGRTTHTEILAPGLPELVPTLSGIRDDAGLLPLVRGHRTLDGAPTQLLRYLEDYAIYSPNTSVLRGTQPDPAQRDPLGLSGGRLAEAIEGILDRKNKRLGHLDLDDVIDLLDWVDAVDVVAPTRQLLSDSVPSLRKVIRFTDRWMSEGYNQLSAYDASEGALYVLFVLTLALHPQSPSFFAIDNFDQTMHPRLARAVTRMFCRQMLDADPPRQVLLTTHNPLVLDGLLWDDRVHLFAVERSRDTGGQTRIYAVPISKSALEAEPSGLSLSNLWVMGRLGGVPDLF